MATRFTAADLAGYSVGVLYDQTVVWRGDYLVDTWRGDVDAEVIVEAIMADVLEQQRANRHVPCAHCGQAFPRRGSHKRFCSRECQTRNRRKRGS
jgi:hypothetical protein